MAVYTLKLHVNGGGEVTTIHVECSDQLAAIGKAESHCDNCRNVEIWHLGELIADVNSSGVVTLLGSGEQQSKANVVPLEQTSHRERRNV